MDKPSVETAVLKTDRGGNQLYFVGIDISKFKHDCAIIDEIGDVVTPSWSFANDCEGFSLLKELLNALDGEKKIGLEATGHYGQNLKLFLENNGFSFMEFNPLLINRFVRSKSLRKTKTDSGHSNNGEDYLNLLKRHRHRQRKKTILLRSSSQTVRII